MKEEFLKFVARIFEVDPASISMETTIGSIEEWDSLRHLQLAMEICDEYGVDISMEKIARVKSIEDFYKFVEKAQ